MAYIYLLLCFWILLPVRTFAQSKNSLPRAQPIAKSEGTCQKSHSGDSSDSEGVFGANAYIGGIAPSREEVEKSRKSGPHVFFRIARVSGELDPLAICKVEKANLNQIRYCYQEFLKQKPGGQINFSLDFKINAEGKAEEFLFEEGKSEATLNSCISKFMQKWHFSMPASKVSVQQTFKFYLK